MRFWFPSLHISLLAALSLLAAGSAAPVRAQPSGGAFETMAIQVGGAANLNRTDFHRFWHPGQGGEMTLQTPFYAGMVETGLALHRYAAAAADVPAFDAVQVHLGWSFPLTLTPRLQWQTGFRLGNYLMRFGDAVQNGHVGCDLGGVKGCGDDVSIIGGDSESEFFMGLHARLHVRLSDAWALYAGGHLLNTYTHERMRLFYAAAGLSYTLQTPGWLRTFLQ